MRILILSEDFPPNVGGIAQWAMGVAKSLSKSGHTVTLMTRYFPKYGKVKLSNINFEVIYIDKKYWKKLRSYYWNTSLKRYLKSNQKPNIIIATTWNCARSIVNYCMKSMIPLITVTHGLDVTRKMTYLKKFWLRYTLMRSNNIIAVSRFTRNYLLTKLGIPSKKIYVFPNGVDIDKFYPKVEKVYLHKHHLENCKVILTLSRVIERKRHDAVIKALPQVIRKISNVKYLICGPWHEKYYLRLRKLINQLKLEKYVIFTNKLSDEELNIYYNLADVYIMPSRYDKETGDSEGFGITYLEANACEKPVIGGRSGGVEDAIVDGKTGFLVNPNDIDEIANKLILLLENSSLANDIGKQGRNRVLKHYTWDIITKKMEESILKKYDYN